MNADLSTGMGNKCKIFFHGKVFSIKLLKVECWPTVARMKFGFVGATK